MVVIRAAKVTKLTYGEFHCGREVFLILGGFLLWFDDGTSNCIYKTVSFKLFVLFFKRHYSWYLGWKSEFSLSGHYLVGIIGLVLKVGYSLLSSYWVFSLWWTVLYTTYSLGLCQRGFPNKKSHLFLWMKILITLVAYFIWCLVCATTINHLRQVMK